MDIATPHNMRASVIKYPYVGVREHCKDTTFLTVWKRNREGVAILTGTCPIDEQDMKVTQLYKTRLLGGRPRRKVTLVDYIPRGSIVTAGGKLSNTLTYGKRKRLHPWTIRLFKCSEGHEVYLDVNKGFCWETDVERISA